MVQTKSIKFFEKNLNNPSENNLKLIKKIQSRTKTKDKFLQKIQNQVIKFKKNED